LHVAAAAAAAAAAATQKLELRLSKTTARQRLTNERIMQRDRTGAMVEKLGSEAFCVSRSWLHSLGPKLHPHLAANCQSAICI